MPINPLTTSNTFSNWLAATNSLITNMNNLTDGTQVTANTLLILTSPGTSLNVRNNAILNTATANAINVVGSGITLNVYSNAVFGNASVIGALTVKDFTVTGVYNPGTISYQDLVLTGFLSAATNVSAGSYMTVGTYINQSGANSTFLGNVLFSNTQTSIFTLGNVSVGKALTITGNTTVASDLVVSGNTSIGPYTETITTFPSVTTNQDLNLRTASVFQLNVATSSAITLTLINPPASRAASATIYLKNGVGGTSIALRGNTSGGSIGKLRYSYDTAPTLNTVLNMVNIISAFTIDGGSNWYISAPIIGSNTA